MISVLAENKDIFDRLGITKWHDAGYFGERGLSLTFERFKVPEVYKEQIIPLFADIFPVQDNPHGYGSAMVHLQVAPKRKLYQACTENTTTHPDGTVTGFLKDAMLPWMLEHKPDIGVASIMSGGGQDSIYGQVSGFCTLFQGAGNFGSAWAGPAIPDLAWLGVAAARIENGAFVYETYSSVSEFVDATSISGTYYPTADGRAQYFTMTSNAGPMLAGMCALVNDFFIDKIGRPLSLSEMYAFIKAHCVDMENVGKDEYTGWGMFILPDPATINHYKWVEHMRIEMPLHSKVITVDGQQMEIDTPITYDAKTQRLMAPVRVAYELAGFTVTWDDTNKKAILEK